MKASVTIMPYINYFNLRISHWEPLMDPWEFAIHVSPSAPHGLRRADAFHTGLEDNISRESFCHLVISQASRAQRYVDVH